MRCYACVKVNCSDNGNVGKKDLRCICNMENVEKNIINVLSERERERHGSLMDVF